MDLETLKNNAVPLTAATVGTVVAVLIFLGLFGPGRDAERMTAERRIGSLEARVTVIESSGPVNDRRMGDALASLDKRLDELAQEVRSLRVDLRK